MSAAALVTSDRALKLERECEILRARVNELEHKLNYMTRMALKLGERVIEGRPAEVGEPMTPAVAGAEIERIIGHRVEEVQA